MEERAQVAKKEADIHRALKQLRDERKEVQSEDDSLKSWSLQHTPKETVADLQLLMTRLHDERHRLKIEREQLAEVFSLISRGGRKGKPKAPQRLAEDGKSKPLDGSRLRMILEVGTASSGDVAELLGELSSLNRRLGGPGVEFLVNECRTWQLAGSASATPAASNDSAKASNSDRSFVEIYAIPKTSPDADAKTNAAHWDRFTASLFMVMRLDAGQANYFELSEAASREHPSFILAVDAGAAPATNQRGPSRRLSRAATHLSTPSTSICKRLKNCVASSSAKMPWCWSWPPPSRSRPKNRRLRPWPKFRSLRAGGVRSASSPRRRSRSEY